MNYKLLIAAVLALTGCGNNQTEKKSSIEWIDLPSEQSGIFNKLYSVFNLDSTDNINDSLAFLILPIQASCPSCREKTIDSIMSHIDYLSSGHYILIASNGGRKTSNSFFREQHYEMPPFTPNFLLDSVNRTGKLDLYKDKPTIYYTLDAKAYKKVSARPSTVRNDLREFFSPNNN